jgi:hypothetical protein
MLGRPFTKCDYFASLLVQAAAIYAFYHFGFWYGLLVNVAWSKVYLLVFEKLVVGGRAVQASDEREDMRHKDQVWVARVDKFSFEEF